MAPGTGGRNVSEVDLAHAVTESRLSRGILSYCKGYCGRAGRRAERSTSRGSKGD